ncbi:MAG: CBS domain-containing protein [Promethearchaeota archaeon]
MASQNEVLVKDIANRNPVTVSRKISVPEAAARIIDYQSSYLIVVNKDSMKPIGILTEKDFMKLVAQNINCKDLIVEKVMSSPLITLKCTDSREKCIETMKENGIKHVVITNKGKLVGVVTIKELLFEESSFIVETHPVSIYVVYRDNGLLIFEYNFRQNVQKEEISSDLFTGAFSTFDTIIPKILGSKGKLKLIEIEDLKILIEHGKYTISILIQDKESIDSRKRLINFKNIFESTYKSFLENYSEKTSLNVFNGAKEHVERIFASKL